MTHIYENGSWVAVGKTVAITPRMIGYWTTCQFSASVYSGKPATYNIEVIDPLDWNYISVKRVSQPTTYSWAKLTTDQFTVPPRDVAVRVSYLFPSFTSSAAVDDFKVTCTY